MQLNHEPPDYAYSLRAADGRSAKVNDQALGSSFFLTPDQLVTQWPVVSATALQVADLEPILALNPALIVLGTGDRQVFPPAVVMAACLSRGIGLEVMNNPAAARTFNILAGEGRRSPPPSFWKAEVESPGGSRLAARRCAAECRERLEPANQVAALPPADIHDLPVPVLPLQQDPVGPAIVAHGHVDMDPGGVTARSGHSHGYRFRSIRRQQIRALVQHVRLFIGRRQCGAGLFICTLPSDG